MSIPGSSGIDLARTHPAYRWAAHQDMWLVLASPRNELLQDATRLRDQLQWLTLLIPVRIDAAGLAGQPLGLKPLALLAEGSRRRRPLISPADHRSQPHCGSAGWRRPCRR